MNKSLKVCIDRIMGAPPPQYVASQEIHRRFAEIDESSYLAIVAAKKWPAGRALTIRFLEGDPYLQNKVKERAMDWTNFANVEFRFVNDKQDADIQISFQQGAGSWSCIGIDANTIDPGKPTMNFGWLDANTPDREYSRVVKHEFGHALGLMHEHQNPEDGINWDKRAVYSSLSVPAINWDPQIVDHNIFERYNKNITQYRNDPLSVMMYYVPADWTLDRRSYGENVIDLSETDKEFIRKLYP